MPLLTSFDLQCRNAPDRPALIEGERRLSYREAMLSSERLAAHLAARIEPGARVALALDRGIDAVIAILSVLRCGACYIPLDIKNPARRLRFIIDDAVVHCIIGSGNPPEWLDTPALWLDIDRLPDIATPPIKPQSAIDPETLVAILYTSGSTGSPKGVALSHRALHNFADWAARTFKLNADDRIASLAPFHFDLSVFDLFSSLSAGACVNFVPAVLTLSPSRLTAWLREQRITVFYTVPSLLGFIALKGGLAEQPLPNLKTLLFAGEVFPTPQLKKLCELLPDTDFYNLYGPTETNVCCYWPVDRARLDVDQAIPIGHPACASELKIDAESCELLVKSANNLSGYWQQGRLTNALSDNSYYRTGDKVSLNERGEYCYHGRLDRMLKCSGYRVEPAEIEALLMQCPEVAHCAVVGISDSASGQRPAAALVLHPGGQLNGIVKTIKQTLPAYMQPCRFSVMDALPLLDNGKTDYQTLQRQLERH
ncbi:amino acid adenylation domain-containing protein [Methylotuvimicrobium sp. KM2]|uniref:amino acid adenylation domain-containing protein n=1 Tax=Methylotuvimicrobium sp. KM2 TaxID=3133976 RepID=UPI003100B1D6